MKSWNELTIEERDEYMRKYIDKATEHGHVGIWNRRSKWMELAQEDYEKETGTKSEPFDFEKAWEEMFLNESFE